MYIETKRMILRNFHQDDLNDLYEIFGHGETMLNVEPPYELEKTKEFLNEFCIDKNGAFAAVEKDSNKVIGYILFKNVDEDDIYEIGWIFNHCYWRMGYAYEVCSILIKYGFKELNAHKIFAEAIDNIKSVGLMKKLGMKLEGVHRKQTKNLQGDWVDLYFYGILRDEFVFNV